MKANLVWILLIGPFFLAAQGIKFEHGLTWEGLLQKAKLENKEIFVDCYATWCGPCKAMDKMIYTSDSVGNYMNASFISVRLQMDSSKEDNEEVRHWYTVAHKFGERYSVTAYPTYLYFSSEGQPLHKDIGFKGIAEFLAVGNKAADPHQQYYSLLASYEHGVKHFTDMAYLANTARRLKEDSLSTLIAVDYMQNYLSLLPWEKRWTRDNIIFIGTFVKVVASQDQIFGLYYQERNRIDSIMGIDGYSDRVINNVIYREQVKDLVDVGLKNHKEPDWSKMGRNIKGKYEKNFAEKNIIRGRVEYYREAKNWEMYAKYFVIQLEQAGIESWKPGPMTALILNNNAFEVFKYSNDKRELRKALNWVNLSLSMKSKPDASTMDTKANLLYKLGKKSEGLALEERSHNLDPGDQEIVESFQKMKNNLPTWPVE